MEKNNCPYCGNNPAPHFINWYFESVNILFTPIRQVVLLNPFFRFVKNKFSGSGLPWKLVKFFKFFGIISLQPDIYKCKVPRAKVLWEEAEKRGIKMQELLLFGKAFDVYIAEKKDLRFKIENLKIEDQASEKPSLASRHIVFSGLPRPSGYNNAALDILDDKAILKKKFLAAGLPVPLGGSAWNFRKALKIFSHIQKSEIRNPKLETNPKSEILNSKSVIVKPRAGSRGRHSTTFVSSANNLKQAFKVAKQLCFWVMVEEQLTGPVYRATLINYELCGVLRGDAPQVVGNGTNNIQELIEERNSGPHQGVKNVVIDGTMAMFLERELQNKSEIRNTKFEMDSTSSPQANSKSQIQNSKFGLRESIFKFIPKAGEVVTLSEKIGVNYGGSSSEDFEICHPDNKQLFVQAAKVAGDPIVGFDFIIPDISKSYKQQKCGFLEANSLPFINLHHDPLLGQPRNVADKVWELVGM